MRNCFTIEHFRLSPGNRQRLWPALAFLSCMGLSLPAIGSENIFLKATCDGIVLTAGGSSVAGLTDHVELSSVHHDLMLPINYSSEGPRPGRFEFGSLRVVKAVSPSSVGFLQVMANSVVCESILVRHFMPTGEGMAEFWQMELGDTLVGERKHWTSAAELPPHESLSFVPTSLRWTYIDNGKVAASYTWNFATNSGQ